MAGIVRQVRKNGTSIYHQVDLSLLIEEQIALRTQELGYRDGRPDIWVKGLLHGIDVVGSVEQI